MQLACLLLYNVNELMIITKCFCFPFVVLKLPVGRFINVNHSLPLQPFHPSVHNHIVLSNKIESVKANKRSMQIDKNFVSFNDEHGKAYKSMFSVVHFPAKKLLSFECALPRVTKAEVVLKGVDLHISFDLEFSK